MLEAHTDTVSIKGMTIPPFEPAIREGRMYGRGAVDDKAGLAAMLHAVASIHADGITPPCEVLLAAVVDEEFSYRGVVNLCLDLAEGFFSHGVSFCSADSICLDCEELQSLSDWVQRA